MGPSLLLGGSLVLAPAFARLSKGVFSHQAREYSAGSLSALCQTGTKRGDSAYPFVQQAGSEQKKKREATYVKMSSGSGGGSKRNASESWVKKATGLSPGSMAPLSSAVTAAASAYGVGSSLLF